MIVWTVERLPYRSQPGFDCIGDHAHCRAAARSACDNPIVPRIPAGTELVRPFLPALDFERSKRFYEAIGFEKLLDSEVAIFRAGSGGFILAPIGPDVAAENLMMQLMVDDLDAWWVHIASLDLVARFDVQPPRAPAMQPWGLRVAYVVDPAGVLWHVAERRPGRVQDG